MTKHRKSETENHWHNPSPEEAVALAMTFMRERAQTFSEGDYFEGWAKALLTRRPLVMLSVLSAGVTDVWLMEPGHEGVMNATIGHVFGKDLGRADIDQQSYLLHDIYEKVVWIMREDGNDWIDGWQLKRGID